MCKICASSPRKHAKWLKFYISGTTGRSRYSHMARCPSNQPSGMWVGYTKMTIPEPKNEIFPVTNRAYLAVGAGCWLFVPSTQQCKTVPTKPVEWGLYTAWKTFFISHLSGLGLELIANNSGLFSGCWVTWNYDKPFARIVQTTSSTYLLESFPCSLESCLFHFFLVKGVSQLWRNRYFRLVARYVHDRPVKL